MPFALLSVLTMPATAIWFYFIGFATLMGSALSASAARSRHEAGARLMTGGSVGIGLLVGPFTYLALASLQ